MVLTKTYTAQYGFFYSASLPHVSACIEINMARVVDSRINHAILGSIRGLTSEDGKTVQFRNIKYGLIPGRWQDPVLYSQKLSETEFDATTFGPSCPQKVGGEGLDFGFVGDVDLTYEPVHQSEFNCLNLVITVPNLTNASSLPVVVWLVFNML